MALWDWSSVDPEIGQLWGGLIIDVCALGGSPKSSLKTLSVLLFSLLFAQLTVTKTKGISFARSDVDAGVLGKAFPLPPPLAGQ